MTVRVLIVDDQALVRGSFRLLVDSADDLTVVGEAGTGIEALALARSARPDVIVMDVRMPEMDGIEATRQISADPALSNVRVLILTTFDLDEYVYEALRAGASGFLLKTATGQALAEAVRVVADGDALLAPSITRRLIAQFARQGPSPPSGVRIEDLTDRETEVLTLIAGGLSNTEIAKELHVAEQTVKTHVSRLLTKLGLRDRTQAAIFAYESGLIRPGIA